jgi:hypothetical protein
MSQALVVLVEEKVIHRDIKNKKIFVTHNGGFRLGFFFFNGVNFSLGNFSIPSILK